MHPDNFLHYLMDKISAKQCGWNALKDVFTDDAVIHKSENTEQTTSEVEIIGKHNNCRHFYMEFDDIVRKLKSVWEKVDECDNCL